MCCCWYRKMPLVSRVCAGCRGHLLVFRGLFFVVGMVSDGVDVVVGLVG